MKSIFLVPVLMSGSTFAQQVEIFVDGRFDDWSEVELALSDPIGDVSQGALDIGRIWLADDPEQRRTLGEQGYAWVQENASRNALATRYLDVMERLI